MHKLWVRFAAWFFAPVLSWHRETSITLAILLNNVRFNGVDIGKLREDLSRRIDDLRIELIAHMSEVKAELGYAMAEKQDSFPVLSMEALEAWEAVQFASSKWERDPQDRGAREREILRWAVLFLKERGWPNPGMPALRGLLVLRDQLYMIGVP